MGGGGGGGGGGLLQCAGRDDGLLYTHTALEPPAGISDPKARARAERTWAKDLSRLAKLAAARQSGAAPSGLFPGHRQHSS